MLKGIVFDLDGTLIDSSLDYAHIRRELEIPNESFILEYLSELPNEIRQDQLLKLERIEVEAAQGARIIDGVRDVVTELRTRALKLGVLTRNCRIATRIALELAELEFDMVITREDAPAKPDPEGLYRILDEWRLKPSELLYVGDFRFDIECGKAAGVQTALFTNRKTGSCDGSVETVETFHADFVFHNFGAFFQLLPTGVFASE
jgi:HAD superfamily hydrolase (TIGR01549 family)